MQGGPAASAIRLHASCLQHLLAPACTNCKADNLQLLQVLPRLLLSSSYISTMFYIIITVGHHYHYIVAY